MRLDRIAAVLRQRSPMEALDLGCAMTRKFAAPIYSSWLLVVWPIALLLNLLFWEYPLLATLAVWWLKPLFERIPLAVVGRLLFGEKLGPKALLKNLLGYLGTGLFAALTIRRLSPWRSYTMPIDSLELLTGEQRQRRAKTLNQDYTGSAMGLTGFCLICELCVYANILAFCAVLFSGFFGDAFQDIFLLGEVLPNWVYSVNNLVILLAMTLVEPFFVSAGFALYINRRVDLEGWDIDLTFRRLANRLKRRSAVLTLIAALLLLPDTGHAGMTELSHLGNAAGQASEANATKHRQLIKEVIADPAFEREEQIWAWQPIDQEEEIKAELDLGFLAGLGHIFAHLLLWLLVGTVLALAIYLLVNHRLSNKPKDPTPAERQIPKALFGLDLRPESLPKNLLQAAQELWNRGDTRGALSLLYRGILAHMVRQKQVDIPLFATEGECVHLVRSKVSPQLASVFTSLTQAWLKTAYGALPVSTDGFMQICHQLAPYLQEEP